MMISQISNIITGSPLVLLGNSLCDRLILDTLISFITKAIKG